MSAPPFGLADLVRPLAIDRFRTEHWAADRAFVGQASEALVSALRSIDGLDGGGRGLLAMRKADVELLGPRGFRSTARAGAAADFLDGGFNLYLRGLEEDLPATRDLFAPLAADLGFGRGHVFVEAFIGRSGQVSTRHYDHDINFQVLLEGKKKWRLQPNPSIKNPLRPFHPSADAAADASRRFREEVYSVDGREPAPRDDAWSTHDVSAGDVVFVPRGTWHEVVSLTDTLAVNLVLKGLTFASGLTGALCARLHRHADFRAYLDGLAIGDATPPSRAEAFEAMKAAAIAELNALTVEEAALSSLGAQRFAWVRDAAERFVDAAPQPALHVPKVLGAPIELDETSAPPVRALVQLRHPFTWEHALFVLADLGAIGARNLVEDLVDLGLLEATS